MAMEDAEQLGSGSGTDSDTEVSQREPVTEAEILASIQNLHLRLEQVRIHAASHDDADNEVETSNDATSAAATTRAPESSSNNTREARLIVVSNRLPVTLSKDDRGDWQFRVSSGGLVSALEGVKNDIPFVWVGWTGKEVAASEQANLKQRFLDDINCFPVFLNADEANLYYNGFCNDVLWPLFHYVPLPIVSAEGDRKFDFKYWDAYSKANHRFAEAVMAVYQPGDVVWVQDYHLMLLPSLLRKRVRDVSIGFFLHTPFPSSEVYRVLPVRSKVLQGVLAADLIGFHTYDYARHFLSVCTRILGLEASPKGIKMKGHFANVGIFPIGIDPSAFSNALKTASVNERIAELEERFEGKRVLLGVDRLDYIKGVPHKLMAIENLLSRHPEWKDKIVLVQIGVPSRTEVDEYKKLISQTNELVGRINGKYGSLDNAPIVFINQSVNFDDLCALYTVADVAVVSSIRDGMNLVSYEYVMCQKERHGVLVLSEFAGSAQSLSGAIRVNPWNIDELAGAIHEALTLPQRERQLRHGKLYHYVNKHTASFWAHSFVSQLQKIERLKSSHEHRAQTQSSLRVTNDVLAEIRNRAQRLFFFAYEGALCNYASLADLAAPPVSLRRSLLVLSSDSRNVVFIMSGRSRQTLESWFGDISVGLISEHGCEYRFPGQSKWEALVGMHDSSWRDSVVPILKYFTERTPGSVLEIKNSVVTWHFRDADPLFGSWQAKELQLLLAESSMNLPVDVISSHSYIELRPVGVSRLAAVQLIVSELSETPADFVLAIGSEAADEQVFEYINAVLRANDPAMFTLCCRVGGKSAVSCADRYVPDVDTALRALEKMASSSVGARMMRSGANLSSATPLRRQPPLPRYSVQRSSSYDTGMRVATTSPSAIALASAPMARESRIGDK